MAKETIKITENEIRQIVAESVIRVLKENDMDEGFFDNIKSAWQGAKAGYNTQKMMDRGVDDFKTEHSHSDVAKLSNPFGPGMDNTAGEQATQLLKQAQMYQAKANQLRAMANKMTKKYGLAKTAVNQRVDPKTQRQPYTPAPEGYQAPGAAWRAKRQFKPETQTTGLWGK